MLICSRVMSNCSMISSMVAPASRFSNTAETGIRVSLNTHAPPSLPGTLSTAGHCLVPRVRVLLLDAKLGGEPTLGVADYAALTDTRPGREERDLPRMTISTSQLKAVTNPIRRSTENPSNL